MTNRERRRVNEHLDEVFHGHTIRQESPTCQCGKVYEAKDLCDAPGVFFRDVEVFGRTFTLIEPVCPKCQRRIPARFEILN